MRDILKAFLKTGTGTVVTLLLNTVTLKMIAVVTGPAGIGILSLLRQIRQTAITLAVFNGQTALIQGASVKKGKLKATYLGTVFVIISVGLSVVVTGMFIFAHLIARQVFGNSDPVNVILVRFLIIPIFFGGYLIFFNGVLNVHRAIGRLAIVQMTSAVAMLVFSYPVAIIVKKGYPEAFVGMMTISILTAVGVAFIFAQRSGWLAVVFSNLKSNVNIAAVRYFFSFSGTMIITGLVVTGTLLLVRTLIVKQGGMDKAGLFDAAWTLSMTYVMLILTSFQTYYLPTLSQISDGKERALLIKRLLRLATLIMVPLVISVIVLKPLILRLLYSNEFIPAITVMRWMLIGDYFKVTSWILAMPMLAYADMRPFFWSEIVTNIMFLILSIWFVIGLSFFQGVGIAFLLMYIGNLIYAIVYSRKRYCFYLEWQMIFVWFIGLLLILGASWSVWSDSQVYFLRSVLWIAGSVGYSWITLKRDERKEVVVWAKDTFLTVINQLRRS